MVFKNANWSVSELSQRDELGAIDNKPSALQLRTQCAMLRL